MIVRIEDLKVGMKVKLVDEELKYWVYGGFVGPMRKYLGKECTISAVGILGNNIRLKEDKGKWLWDIDLIEKIVDDKKNKNRIYTTLKEIRKESLEDNYIKLISCSSYTNILFRFDKCIVNNNCVIGVFVDDKRTYKGIAKCHPDDKFDLAKGLTITMLRAYKDYLNRKIKSLY